MSDEQAAELKFWADRAVNQTVQVVLATDYDALRVENERLKAENASLKDANNIDLGEKAPLIFENTELRAENERLLREQAEFTGVALCALGLNRDEYVSPGNQVLDEINRLTTKVSELTRLLGEAEERATILAQTILALMQKHSVYLKGKAVGMSDGEAFASAVSDALKRALKGASR